MNSSRYQVQERLPEVGIQGQQKLKQTRVAVVGCGGLGNFCLQSLVAMGIGNITIIDDDTVDVSNLQRQVLFKEKDVGKPKVGVAKRELEWQNSEVIITTHKFRVTSKNCDELLKDSEIIIDCTDNFATRLVMDQYCSSHKIPLVYGGIRGFEGNVSVFNYKGGKSLKESFTNHEEIFQSENCLDSGVMPQVVAMTANLQVNEIVKIILELPHVLQGKLQVFNLLKNNFRMFDLK